MAVIYRINMPGIPHITQYDYRWDAVNLKTGEKTFAVSSFSISDGADYFDVSVPEASLIMLELTPVGDGNYYYGSGTPMRFNFTSARFGTNLDPPPPVTGVTLTLRGFG